MKGCPNCKYLWPDEHTGPCVECGNPMSAVAANGDGGLAFRFAKQVQDGAREGAQIDALAGARSPRAQLAAYSGIKVADPVMEKARALIVQTGEVEYEDDGEE